jgi:hypothetical protein
MKIGKNLRRALVPLAVSCVPLSAAVPALATKGAQIAIIQLPIFPE